MGTKQARLWYQMIWDETTKMKITQKQRKTLNTKTQNKETMEMKATKVKDTNHNILNWGSQT